MSSALEAATDPVLAQAAIELSACRPVQRADIFVKSLLGAPDWTQSADEPRLNLLLRESWETCWGSVMPFSVLRSGLLMGYGWPEDDPLSSLERAGPEQEMETALGEVLKAFATASQKSIRVEMTAGPRTDLVILQPRPRDFAVRPDAIRNLLSHMLRHAPETYFLQMDSQGWVDAECVVMAIRYARRGSKVDFEGLRAFVANDALDRFELSEGRIRARYGHSYSGFVGPAPSSPPTTLLHATSRQAFEEISCEGLCPQRRVYVHLTDDLRYAETVSGTRDNGLVISIDSRSAHIRGIPFRQANRHVWLAPPIPPEFLQLPGAINNSETRAALIAS